MPPKSKDKGKALQSAATTNPQDESSQSGNIYIYKRNKSGLNLVIFLFCRFVRMLKKKLKYI